MIYAIRAVGTGFIKFGRVDHGLNLDRRLKGLQIGCPFALEVVVTGPGGKDEENKIHNYLIRAGLHHQGEWFKEGPAADDVISHMRVGLRGLLNPMPSSVIELRTINRHRRLGAALALSDKIIKDSEKP